MRRENDLLKEALQIKTDLENIKASRRRLKDGRKSNSSISNGSSTLNQTIQSERSHMLRSDRKPTMDDWYNADVDVSVSSTGSDIRQRLHAGLNIYPSNQSGLSGDPSPIKENIATAMPKFNQKGYSPMTQYSPLPPPAASQPIWVSRNPHLASVFDPNSAPTLPPLFRSPVTSSMTSWSIPQPVLFGLGSHSNN